MRRFCQLYEALDGTARTNAKVEAIVRYLEAAPAEDAAWATFFLTGQRLERLVEVSDRLLVSPEVSAASWAELLVPVAKAYSGLAEQEIAALDRWIRAHTVDRFGPVPQVEAVHVFELAFEGITRSTRHKSGIALRFPRIARWRTDKPAALADRLEQVHALLERS